MCHRPVRDEHTAEKPAVSTSTRLVAERYEFKLELRLEENRKTYVLQRYRFGNLQG